MELKNVIRNKLVEFVGKNYGETEEDACYNLELLAEEIATEVENKCSELIFRQKERMYTEADISMKVDEMIEDFTEKGKDTTKLLELSIAPSILVDKVLDAVSHNQGYFEYYWQSVKDVIEEHIDA